MKVVKTLKKHDIYKAPLKVILEERDAALHGIQTNGNEPPFKSFLPLGALGLPSNTPIPRPTIEQPPSKQHPDPISRFATIHFPER